MVYNDELYEIFSWLPPKLLHELSSTSKPCSEYLSEIGFMEKQCRNSLRKPQEYLLIQDDHSSRSNAHYLQVCELSNSRPTEGKTSALIPSQEFKYLKQNGRVVASGNGLLLYQTWDHQKPTTELFLCNPTTKRMKNIKPPSVEDNVETKDFDVNNISGAVSICGKNYFDNHNKFPSDFTILLFYDSPSTPWSNCRDVYILKDGNNWVLAKENLYIGPGNMEFQNPVHCTDGLYFLSDAGTHPYYVLHYDIHHYSSRILALPDKAQDSDTYGTRVGIFGWEKSNADHSSFRSICLVKVVSSSGTISIWTLDTGTENHTKLSWHETSVMDKSILHDLGIKDVLVCQPNFAVIEKKLIIAVGRYVHSYSLESSSVHKAERIFKINDDNFGGRVKFDCYSPTLRPFAKDTIKQAKQRWIQRGTTIKT